MHALDFAGGTVVHLTAGMSALVCALVLGKRLKYPQERPLPHNLTMTLTGAGILWFGWFGFNAGSALDVGRARGARVRDDAPRRRGRRARVARRSSGRTGRSRRRSASRRASSRGSSRSRRRRATSRRGRRSSSARARAASATLAVLAKYKYRLRRHARRLRRPRRRRPDRRAPDRASSRRRRSTTRAATARSSATPHQLRRAGHRVRRVGRLRGRRDVRAAQARSTRLIGLRVTEQDEREGLDTTQHGEEGYAG